MFLWYDQLESVHANSYSLHKCRAEGTFNGVAKNVFRSVYEYNVFVDVLKSWTRSRRKKYALFLLLYYVSVKYKNLFGMRHDMGQSFQFPISYINVSKEAKITLQINFLPTRRQEFDIFSRRHQHGANKHEQKW